MSRSDLKDLGETLDDGQCAVVAVAAAAIADRVAETLKGAEKVDRKELKADPKAVQDDVAAAGRRLTRPRWVRVEGSPYDASTRTHHGPPFAR